MQGKGRAFLEKRSLLVRRKALSQACVTLLGLKAWKGDDSKVEMARKVIQLRRTPHFPIGDVIAGP
jgi:hypothetical protein